MRRKDAFHEFEGKTTQSVSPGNHQLADFSAHRAFQNGRKTAAVPVDSAADVGDDFVVRVLVSEVLDLPFEVGTLVFAADSGVADSGSSGDLRFRLGALTEDRADVV